MTNAKRVRADLKSPKYVDIVCISDTHSLHRECEVPSDDILIHAGDFTMLSESAASIIDFNDWIGELPHACKLIVPGNHEFFLASDLTRRSLISNARLLINEAVDVMGLKIWGSPVTTLQGGAFGLSSEMDRSALYSKIPKDVDIIVTHGPPHGILDCAPGETLHYGCRPLRKAVQDFKPKIHIFGHNHSGYGTVTIEDTLFINAALMGPLGELSNSPIIRRMSQS